MYKLNNYNQTCYIYLVQSSRMKLRGSLVIIICCCLLQFSNLAQTQYLFSLGGSLKNPINICGLGFDVLSIPTPGSSG